MYRESYESIKAKLGKANYFKCCTFGELVQRFQDYDVVYSRNDITEPFFFKFVMGYRKVPPIIFGCHIPHVYPIAEKLHAKLHNLLFTSFFYNWLASGVTGYHVINNFTLKAMSRQFPKRRVEKIYYPFNFEAFAANADQFPFAGKLDQEKFNIIWVGRLVEQKGVNDLVRLMQEAGGLKPQVEHGPPRKGDVRHSLADISQARQKIGFDPQVDLANGLIEYMRWARAASV